METRHINVKSDFVIRERFRDGTGKVVALPDVDFELRYWVGSKSVKASRKDGVLTNCVADGDALLVIFKDHGLGEGELHHELHLAQNNPLCCDGVQKVYYPESLHIWLWDKMGDTEGVIESDCVAAYTRGYKFTWEDFTPANILELQKPAMEAAERADTDIREFIRVAQKKSDTAVKNAQNAASEAKTATTATVSATTNANTATTACKKATDAANDATKKAIAATSTADTATKNAKTATTEATTATDATKKATTESIDATGKAKTATAYANEAGQQAAAAAERLEATRGEMEIAIARAEQVVQGVPNGLKVEAPETVTLGNPAKQYIKPRVKPDGCAQNVIYQTDGQSIEVEPSGEIQAREAGSTRVHVIPTQGTKYYKTIKIEVVPPRIRLTNGGIRLDKQGNIRLT